MNLAVVGPRVFIRPESLPEMTEDGTLHLVHDRSNSTMKGTVVAVGDGPEFVKRAIDSLLDDADDLMVPESIAELRQRFQPEHMVSVGDRVLFSPASGEELIFERDLYVAMREDDILAVIE